ncbi:hypothetical protein [Yinghuangia soli]|uniref:Uncharacterized protein n=1 Tax=Yinghuangia soli TaxID=2908204 RepID=A0AA41Q8Q8_9ACTN|nr:hypothetical protein [Yinghuangia soli]MCF2533513.1 hypothetical protein [Yinghuangia soli]
MSHEPPAAPGPPPDAAEDAGLRSRTRRHGGLVAVLGIAGAVALVLGLVALIGRATETDAEAPKLVLPPAAAGLVRMDETVDMAQVRGRLDDRGAAAAYGRAGAARADVIVVVAADRRSGAAAGKLDRFYAELRSSEARVDPAQFRRADPGPGRGVLQCHPVVYPVQNLTLDMCVWADEHTVGSVVALPGADNVGSIDELARLTRDMRVDLAAVR